MNLNPPIDAPYEALPPPQKADISLPVIARVHTGLRNYGVVAQPVDGRMVLAVTGEAGPAYSVRIATQTGGLGSQHVRSALVCFDSSGQVLWRHDFADREKTVHAGVYPAFVAMSDDGEWAVSCCVRKEDSAGDMRLYSIAGEILWRTEVPGARPWSNGACVWGDLDADGKIEIVFGNCSDITCVEAATGAIKWSFADGVATCHGRLALGDVDGDGKDEIVFGSEYADDPGRRLSSMFVLDGWGKVKARQRSMLGDFGSTQVVLADVEGDGVLEITIANQNLCWGQPRHPSCLNCFDGNLIPLYEPLPTGGPRWAAADVDRDGKWEALGITDYRDGGPLERFYLWCVDLSTGKMKWTTPVTRCWLTGDPVLADLDGDGELELLVTTNYGTGYAFQPDTTPWSDLYVVKADGRIIFTCTFPDMIYSPIVLDVNGDGRNEVVAPCYDGFVYVLGSQGIPGCDNSWPVMQQNCRRTGTSQRPAA